MILIGKWQFPPLATAYEKQLFMLDLMESIVDASSYNRKGLIEGEWNLICEEGMFTVTRDCQRLAVYKIVEDVDCTRLVRL